MSDSESNPLSSPGDPDIQASNLENEGSAVLPKIVKFSELARCGDEIWIECESQLYRLRKTKQGKLILTK
ncbi:MAG: hemin uptake protein HemP [Planctomycetota bacterium]|nr:hemin uptake protein HemP [Planctomycetota bacterium]